MTPYGVQPYPYGVAQPYPPMVIIVPRPAPAQTPTADQPDSSP
jgi:hypothetical protein